MKSIRNVDQRFNTYKIFEIKYPKSMKEMWGSRYQTFTSKIQSFESSLYESSFLMFNLYSKKNEKFK